VSASMTTDALHTPNPNPQYDSLKASFKYSHGFVFCILAVLLSLARMRACYGADEMVTRRAYGLREGVCINVGVTHHAGASLPENDLRC